MVNIKQLMIDYSITQRQMAEIIDCTQSEVSFFSNGKRRLGARHVEALVAHFGQDTIDAYTIVPKPMAGIAKKAQVPDTVDDIRQEIKEEIEAEEIKGDVLPVKCDKPHLGNCRATMPFVSNDLAQSRDIDIRRLVLFEPDKLEQFTLAKVFRGVDYIQRVITEAMEPYYFPGDYLLVSFLPLQGDIISGATYLLDTKVYGTMLRKVIVRKEGYLLKPHNAEFDEVLLKREDVYSISIVVSMFRTNTNLTLASNLATLVKNRDEQIKRMVETQQQILDELCRQNERLDKERERTERERERTDKLIEKIINQ